MKASILSSILCLLICKCFSQDGSSIEFTKKKQQIDNISTTIDNNKSLERKNPTGKNSLVGTNPKRGSFKYDFYYIPMKEIKKLEYKFESVSTLPIVTYYDKNELIKINDNDTLYYYIKGIIYDVHGTKNNSDKIKD